MCSDRLFDPHDRQLLLEALKPPEGYSLDCAVGATFSLDLLALLTAQIAFTFFDWQDDEGRPAADPLALLESVRRNADRIAIFCQAGEIAVPTRYHLLFGYLEDSIVVVAPRSDHGVFHPKLWVLRFVSPSSPVKYRLLCMSRNLTFDRSWDVILSLDGELQDRKNAIAVNHPLGNFISSLPGLALDHPLPDRIRSHVDLVQREIRKVAFELPEPFEDYRFWSIGITGGPRWPFKGRIDRMLTVSPFLTPELLARLTDGGDDHVLVSRLDSLQSMDRRTLRRFRQVYFMNPDADELDGTIGEADTALTGLHAKIYVAEAGWEASVLIGSANATHGAFSDNVEFLVELIGMKSQCGIDSVLGLKEEESGFDTLLVPFTPGDVVQVDPIQERLERLLQEVRSTLAKARLIMRVVQTQAGEFMLTVVRGAEEFELPENVTANCWPISLREATTAVPLQLDKPVVAEFGPVSFEAITPFLAVGLVATEGSMHVSSRFVLSLTLKGAPTDRKDAIMRSLLRNQADLIRLLLLILAEGGPDLHDLINPSRSSMGSRGKWAWGLPDALFEALVRALERDPGKLDQVARVIEDLEKTPEGRNLLPQGLASIWPPIWQARQRLGR